MVGKPITIRGWIIAAFVMPYAGLGFAMFDLFPLQIVAAIYFGIGAYWWLWMMQKLQKLSEPRDWDSRR